MKAVQAPLLRWPGGCFADSYDWRDGLGAAANRPARTGFWGQQDPNQLSDCTSLCTPAAPLAASPIWPPTCVRCPRGDFYQEIEYCNAPRWQLVPSNSAAPATRNALAAQRAANGDCRALQRGPVGCGQRELGMRRQPRTRGVRRRCFRKFTAWTPSYSRTPLRFVAVGPNGDDVDWTRRLFKSALRQLRNAVTSSASPHALLHLG
jgi:alpha-N-arabinofuranosidase